ncbi:LOW QUALITY PROTEIN: TBC1 domain family member 1-like [Amphiura filiformis]|uniref:LOW QUALITY PROTEIN: TBC1 domain family member 1-like n=1 Tax=Amphiura filiformis TaxID=82378 RepID=UPI003B222504
MLFQIGKAMLTLISPDQKSFMLTKKFRDISFCSQGIQQPEYFGFICREKSHNSNYMCYVFKCESEAVVESIMGTLRQAFNTALANSRLHVICETCPMHQLHKLCEQVQGQPPDKVHIILNKQLQTLTEIQRDMIHNKLKLLKPTSQQEMNELVMSMLRAVCEEQQKTHRHIGEGDSASNSPNSEANKLKLELNKELLVKKLPDKPAGGRKSGEKAAKEPESRFKKAKKSLTTSFENLLNRSKSRTSTEKSLDEEDETIPEETGFANTGYTSRRNTMTESDADLLKEALNKEFLKKSAEKSVGDSPGPSRSDSPVPITSTPSSIATSPSSLTDNHNSNNTTKPPRPLRMSTEVSPSMGHGSPPVTRPRSKTLGDLPSPREGPVVDQIFKTPIRRPDVGPKHKPLARAMSFDERSPRSPRTPFMTPSRRSSWRQAIFQRVVTPMAESKPVPGIVEEEEEGVFPNQLEGSSKGVLTPPRFTSKNSIRAMWRKAIMEQILLIRMERENINLKARQDAAHEKRIKLNYEELNPCLIHATKEWERLLIQPNKSTAKVDEDEINRLFKQGIPRSKRGEIWTFLVDQHKLRKQSITMAIPHHDSYVELLKRLTTHQHSILIDLGRTFPTHAYFANPLGRGQLSLFNLLKAFSLLDEEVGYCQGLSFVAGVLLMHLDEEDAFEMLVYLMFGLGFRRQYRPDMTSLQIQMYQLERLLHDHHRRLHDHLQINDIAPSLYAAPWFLTIFASQFPLGFVSKVFDLIFLQGFDVIFKVALLILGIHEELLLACNGFEATIEFLKNNLPTFGVVQMEKVINQACSMDISKELHSYEVEYHIFQEEMIPTPMQHNATADMDSMEKANRNLRRHNNQLLEQLQAAHNTVHNHEETISSLRENESSLKSEIRNLNLERDALLNTVSKLRTLIPENVLQEAGINFTAPIYHKKTSSSTSSTNSNNRIGLDDLKRLNKEAKGDEHDGDDVNGSSKRASQRSSDSSISNISSDIESPIFGNKN